MPGQSARVRSKPKPSRQRTLKLEERQLYYDARAAGLGKLAAAAQAGVTDKTAKKWEDAWIEAGNPDFDKQKITEPKRERSELNPDARRALDDFNYFQERYLGRVALPWQKSTAEEVVELANTPAKEYVVANMPPGSGKAESLDQPILTTIGWSTIGELRVGDFVYDETGKPTKVIAKSEVWHNTDCYEVTTDDGVSTIVSGEHLWDVRLDGRGQYSGFCKPDYPGKTGPKPTGRNGIKTYSTEFLAKKRSKRPQLEIAAPLQTVEVPLPIDPYVLGAWLGDGDTAGGRMTAAPEDAKWIRQYFEDAGYVTTEQSKDTRFGVIGLKVQLRALGVLNNKHVPEAYLFASPAQRLALLQGLIDSDGHVSPTGHIEFCNTNKRLAESVQFLVHSLGAKASLNTGRATLYGKDCGEKHRAMFYLKDAARIPRKALLTRDGCRTKPRYLTVTKVASVPTQCIQVDSPNHLYLTGKGLMVTHNSTLFTHDIPCWLIARNRGVRILILSSTNVNAAKFSDRIKRTLESTVPFKADDDERRLGQAKDAVTTMAKDFGRFQPEERGTWTKARFVVERPSADAAHKDATVEAYGRDQDFLGGRYNIVIVDDVYTPKNSKTHEAKQEIKKWFRTVAQSRLEPNGLLIVAMQRVDSEDLSNFCLEMEAFDLADDPSLDEEAAKKITAAKEAKGLIPLPIRDDKRRKYRHFKYQAHFEDVCKGHAYHAVDSPAYPEGCLLYPSRLSYEELEGIKRNEPFEYATWYQQEDTPAGQVLVDPVWIKGGVDEYGIDRPGCWDKSRGARELPEGLSSDLFSFITVDPSPSQFWACEWWIYHRPSEELYLIDLVRQKMTSPQFFDMNVNDSSDVSGVLVEMYNASVTMGAPITHLVPEVNAAQKFMYQQRNMLTWLRMHSIALMPHTTTAENKHSTEYGVQTLQTWFKDGRIRLPGRQNDFLNTRTRSMKLVSEAEKYRLDGDTSYTTDCVMACWFATKAVQNMYRAKKTPPKLSRPSWTSSGRPNLGVISA